MSRVTISLNVHENICEFDTSITEAIEHAELQLTELNETIDSINNLKPECDTLDYALAASSGALCGIIDIFLVGKPGESPIGELTDQWFENRVKDFAALCGWDRNKKTLASAIRCLEDKFQICYDQRGMGDAASFVYKLNAKNHHFKSLGHNPTLLGLFFSILNQFTNTSHFVSNGDLMELQEASKHFILQGNSIPAKLFCGFVNWFGHLISDVSGSSDSKTRGMGIPAPFWTWTNGIIAMKRSMNLPASKFDKSMNELALEIYTKGYDLRFQTAQMIPVFLNELIVRLLYSTRRMVQYFIPIPPVGASFKQFWNHCEPFANPTVKRMLTVAHGTFCLIDLGDAAIRSFIAGGGHFHATEFVMRMNIAGIGRCVISLYGECKRAVDYHKKNASLDFALREKSVIENYISGLKELEQIYNDREYILLIAGVQSSNAYRDAFASSVTLAEMRGVPSKTILINKSDIDSFFNPQGGEQ